MSSSSIHLHSGERRSDSHPPQSVAQSASCGVARITQGKLEALVWTACIVALAIVGTLALLKVGVLTHMNTYASYGILSGVGALTITALIRFIVKSCCSPRTSHTVQASLETDPQSKTAKSGQHASGSSARPSHPTSPELPEQTYQTQVGRSSQSDLTRVNTHAPTKPQPKAAESSQHASDSSAWPPHPTSPELPEQTYQAQMGGSSQSHLITQNTDKIHSPKERDSTEKMNIALDYAIREGVQGDKNSSVFSLPLAGDNVSVHCDQSINNSSVGATEHIGIRRTMEDVHFVESISFVSNRSDGLDVSAQLVVVCDGHNDEGRVGQYLKGNLVGALKTELDGSDLGPKSIADAWTKVMVDFDEKCRIDQKIFGGSTVTAAFIFKKEIYIINVGDSRTILCKPGVVYQLSEDAKPGNERFSRAINKREELHIDATHNRITIDNLETDLGEEKIVIGHAEIGVARDIGLGFLSPRPKITRINRSDAVDDLQSMSISCPSGSYLVLACDGLWDVASNIEVYKAIAEMEQLGMEPREMSVRLTYGALASRSQDNITVVVVKV